MMPVFAPGTRVGRLRQVKIKGIVPTAPLLVLVSSTTLIDNG